MLANLLRRGTEPAEERALQITPWGPWTNQGQSAAGITVSVDSSLQLLTVWGCVQLISDTIATLPRDIYRKNADGINEEVTVKPRWFEQPSASVDIIEFLTQSLVSLLLDGNAYWAYGVDLNFLPNEIHVLDPLKVQVKDDGKGGPLYLVNGQRFKGRLLHIKGLTRPGMLKGLSPIESARQAIGLGLGAQEFAGRFYSNGTILSGVIETPDDLTQDQAGALRDSWSRDHGGAVKAHRPGVLTNGASWKPLGIPPEQAQFLQTREYQAAEISAQLFLLDPSMLGIASAGTRGQNLTYANLEQRGIHLVQFTLMRWIIRLERAFTFLLPKPQFHKFNVDAIQRADLKTRYEAYQIALGNKPFMKLNEIRALEDEPPVPGGDKIDTTTPAPASGLQTFPTPAKQPAQKNGHKTVTKIVERGKDGRIDHIVEVGS